MLLKNGVIMEAAATNTSADASHFQDSHFYWEMLVLMAIQCYPLGTTNFFMPKRSHHIP